MDDDDDVAAGKETDVIQSVTNAQIHTAAIFTVFSLVTMPLVTRPMSSSL